MHNPLQHAADTLLQREHDITLKAWLRKEADTSGTVLSVKIARATDDVIIVDKRTAEKWRDEANAMEDDFATTIGKLDDKSKNG